MREGESSHVDVLGVVDCRLMGTESGVGETDKRERERESEGEKTEDENLSLRSEIDR